MIEKKMSNQNKKMKKLC